MLPPAFRFFTYNNTTFLCEIESPNLTKLFVGICVIYIVVRISSCNTATHCNNAYCTSDNTANYKANHHVTSKYFADRYSLMNAILHRVISRFFSLSVN